MLYIQVTCPPISSYHHQRTCSNLFVQKCLRIRAFLPTTGLRLFISFNLVMAIVKGQEIEDRRASQHPERLKKKKKPKPIKVNTGNEDVDRVVKHVCDTWWCSAILRVVRFSINFGLVMGVLFGGAMIFSEIEDPYPPKMCPHEIIRKKDLESSNTSEFWLALQNKFSLHCLKLSGSDIEEIRDLFEKHIQNVQIEKNEKDTEEKRRDRLYIFKKWFYFTNIISTTIGNLVYNLL